MTKKITKKEIHKKILDYGFISYILGIIALVESFISPLAGIILGIIGLIFSLKEKSILSEKGKKLNTIAIIIGAILLIAMIIISATNIPYGIN